MFQPSRSVILSYQSIYLSFYRLSCLSIGQCKLPLSYVNLETHISFHNFDNNSKSITAIGYCDNAVGDVCAKHVEEFISTLVIRSNNFSRNQIIVCLQILARHVSVYVSKFVTHLC